MWDYEYNELLTQVLDVGETVHGRNGTTRSVFGTMISCYDLEDSIFPILTTRKIYYEGIFGELAAFVRGATRLLEFKNWGCNYWDANAIAWHRNKDKSVGHMEVGRIYGSQWRNFDGHDQLKALLLGLKLNPTGRRHVLTSYNPAEVEQGCLPPCHLLAQYSVRRQGTLESCIYMRSVDLCVGLPTDMVLYAAMQVVIAHELNLQPGAITFMLGDAHIYENHLPLLEEQLARKPRHGPVYEIAPDTKLLNFRPTDLTLPEYKHYDPIKYPFNV
jgi:thymidylate synthase